MVTYYADDIIIPGYTQMQQKITALHAAAEAFITAPSATTQAAGIQAYKEAHLQYERIAPFQFGPAETALLDNFVNFTGGLDYSFTTAGELTGFSIDTVAIENNITAGTYNLSAMTRSSFYSQGFPALNYLLFSPTAVSRFGTNTANRIAYVQAVLQR